MLHINSIVWCQLVLTVPSQIMQPIYTPYHPVSSGERSHTEYMVYCYHSYMYSYYSRKGRKNQTEVIHHNWYMYMYRTDEIARVLTAVEFPELRGSQYLMLPGIAVHLMVTVYIPQVAVTDM